MIGVTLRVVHTGVAPSSIACRPCAIRDKSKVSRSKMFDSDNSQS